MIFDGFWSKVKTISYCSRKQLSNIVLMKFCKDYPLLFCSKQWLKNNSSLISSISRIRKVSLKASKHFSETRNMKRGWNFFDKNFGQKINWFFSARNGFNSRPLPINRLNDLSTWKQTCVHRGNGASWQEARKLCDQPTPSSLQSTANVIQRNRSAQTIHYWKDNNN